MMMKRRLYLSVALLFCCVGCRKDGTQVVEVVMQSFSTPAKVYLDNNYCPVWHDGDEICVNGQTYEVSNGSVTVHNVGDMHALYPAADKVDYTSSGKYNVELPRVQRYVVDNSGNQHIEALMAACGRGSQLQFVNLCSLLKVTVPAGVTVLNIDVNTTDSSAAMSGKGEVSFDDNTPQFAFKSADTFPYTRLDCGTGVCRTDRTYYVVVPPFENKKLTITVCGFIGGKKFRHTFTQSTNATLLSSQYAPSVLPAYTFQSVDSLYAGTDVLCEPFSVTKSKKKYFSKGNLQFRSSPYEFRIANSQYEVIGAANNAISGNNPNWIDLFGWGTSGYSTCAVPWENSYDNSVYKVDADGTYNMSPTTDWGTNLGDWITVTKQYWEVMLQDRSQASDKTGMAVIGNTHHGLVVLPDYWVLPNGCRFAPSGINQYTFSQWNAMEAAGALFLPAAGRREGSNVMEVDSKGYYWTGTRKDRSEVYSLQFGNTLSSISITPDQPHLGYSVRLVK